MTGFRARLSEDIRTSFLSLINSCFEIYKVDIDELKGKGYNDYRKIRPYGGNCNC